jgi:hypothetical protein
MTFWRLIAIVLTILIVFIVSSGCSTNRKLKKKCLDCPEFSYTRANNPHIATGMDEIK